MANEPNIKNKPVKQDDQFSTEMETFGANFDKKLKLDTPYTETKIDLPSVPQESNTKQFGTTKQDDESSIIEVLKEAKDIIENIDITQMRTLFSSEITEQKVLDLIKSKAQAEKPIGNHRAIGLVKQHLIAMQVQANKSGTKSGTKSDSTLNAGTNAASSNKFKIPEEIIQKYQTLFSVSTELPTTTDMVAKEVLKAVTLHMKEKKILSLYCHHTIIGGTDKAERFLASFRMAYQRVKKAIQNSGRQPAQLAITTVALVPVPEAFHTIIFLYILKKPPKQKVHHAFDELIEL